PESRPSGRLFGFCRRPLKSIATDVRFGQVESTDALRFVVNSRQFFVAFLLFGAALEHVRGDAMLQLFNLSWNEVTEKIPEIAEAGYFSLWLPPLCKAGSGFSIGYDLFDFFDLGDKNQRGTVSTHYGSKTELLRTVVMAHRLGLRVYFDNIVNHR